MGSLWKRIDDFIIQKISPGIISHGGRIEILTLEQNILTIGLSGACSTCSLDAYTKEGIAEYLMNEFPDLEDCQVVDIEVSLAKENLADRIIE